MHQHDVDDPAQLLVDHIGRPLRDIQRQSADRAHDVRLERRNLRTQNPEVVVAVGAVVHERRQTPVRLLEGGILDVGRRGRSRHDHVVAARPRRVSRQRDVQPVRRSRQHGLDVRTKRTRRGIDRRDVHADVDEAVAEGGTRDVARAGQGQSRRRGPREGQHAASVHTECVLFPTSDIVDKARLFVRHPVAEGRLTGHEVRHRLFRHADTSDQLLHVDPTLCVGLISRGGIRRILTREERAGVPTEVMREDGAEPALPINLLDRELFLQGERIVHAFGNALLEHVFGEAAQSRGVRTDEIHQTFAGLIEENKLFHHDANCPLPTELAAVRTKGFNQCVLDSFRIVVVELFATGTRDTSITSTRDTLLPLDFLVESTTSGGFEPIVNPGFRKLFHEFRIARFMPRQEFGIRFRFLDVGTLERRCLSLR